MTLPLLVGLLAAPALAAPPETPKGPSAVVGVEVDAAVTVDSPPASTVLPRLDVGVTLPFAAQRVEVFATGGVAPLVGKGTEDDPRVDGGSYAWKVTQTEGIVGGGLRVRFLPLASRFNAHASLAGAAFVHRTKATGDAAGDAFGENREAWTSGGLLAAVGASVKLGPGLLGLDVGVAWTSWSGTITGERDWLAVTPGLSYRLLLGKGAPR